MNSQIEISDTFGLTIKRGPGYGFSENLSSIYSSGKELPDIGAKISIQKGFSDDFKLIIDFGYTSPSMKEYGRSIDINLDQTLKLLEYLNHLINEEKKRKSNSK